MRTVHGHAENDCFNFGNEWYNTKCYQYQFEPGRLSPAGLGDCVGSFKATAATFYDSENLGVQCSFFKGLNCKDGKVEGLYGCPAKFWGESNQEIHSWRCVSVLPSSKLSQLTNS
jgi:hypothetical protein